MKKKRINLIDGFRGIAIFSVLAYHANFVINDIHLFAGGYLGVDIFFIISGYINSYILINDLKKNISITDFYIRRIKRLLPLFLIVILITFFFFWIINKDNLFLNELTNSIIASFLFISNYYFHYEGLGYAMDIGKVKPLLHTWSLSVEFQFLFIFPIILFLLFKFYEKFKYLFAFLVIVISIYLTNKISLNHPSFNFYFTITRIWEFFLGFYIYILKEKYNENYNSAITNTLQIICLIIIFYSIFFFEDTTPHPSFQTLPLIISVSLLLFFNLSNRNKIYNFLTNKIFVNTGLVSYSLYLWHYPILKFFELSFFTFNNFLKFFCILLTFLISIFTYKFVELRIINNKRFKISYFITFYIFIIFALQLLSDNYFNKVEFKNKHPFLNFNYYESEKSNFQNNYNYQNFGERKNVFIVGDSYAFDFLTILSQNDNFSKKYNFYTTKPSKIKNQFHGYSVKCFLDFLKKNNTTCRNINFNDLLKKQYEEADYLILSGKSNKIYNKNLQYFLKNIKNKKLLIVLDDVVDDTNLNLNSLDRFVYFFNRIPDFNERKKIEKKIYYNSKKYEKVLIKKIIKQLEFNNILYLKRSDIQCNNIKKRCKILTDENKKIYVDSGHLTIQGAKYFADKITDNEILKNFLDTN